MFPHIIQLDKYIRKCAVAYLIPLLLKTHRLSLLNNNVSQTHINNKVEVFFDVLVNRN